MLSSGMGLRRGWPGGCYWKMEPRKGMQREETEVPGVSTKEVEAIQAPLENGPEKMLRSRTVFMAVAEDGGLVSMVDRPPKGLCWEPDFR